MIALALALALGQAQQIYYPATVVSPLDAGLLQVNSVAADAGSFQSVYLGACSGPGCGSGAFTGNLQGTLNADAGFFSTLVGDAGSFGTLATFLETVTGPLFDNGSFGADAGSFTSLTADAGSFGSVFLGSCSGPGCGGGAFSGNLQGTLNADAGFISVLNIDAGFAGVLTVNGVSTLAGGVTDTGPVTVAGTLSADAGFFTFISADAGYFGSAVTIGNYAGGLNAAGTEMQSSAGFTLFNSAALGSNIFFNPNTQTVFTGTLSGSTAFASVNAPLKVSPNGLTDTGPLVELGLLTADAGFFASLQNNGNLIEIGPLAADAGFFAALQTNGQLLDIGTTIADAGEFATLNVEGNGTIGGSLSVVGAGGLSVTGNSIFQRNVSIDGGLTIGSAAGNAQFSFLPGTSVLELINTSGPTPLTLEGQINATGGPSVIVDTQGVTVTGGDIFDVFNFNDAGPFRVGPGGITSTSLTINGGSSQSYVVSQNASDVVTITEHGSGATVSSIVGGGPYAYATPVFSEGAFNVVDAGYIDTVSNNGSNIEGLDYTGALFVAGGMNPGRFSANPPTLPLGTMIYYQAFDGGPPLFAFQAQNDAGLSNEINPYEPMQYGWEETLGTYTPGFGAALLASTNYAAHVFIGNTGFQITRFTGLIGAPGVGTGSVTIEVLFGGNSCSATMNCTNSGAFSLTPTGSCNSSVIGVNPQTATISTGPTVGTCASLPSLSNLDVVGYVISNGQYMHGGGPPTTAGVQPGIYNGY